MQSTLETLLEFVRDKNSKIADKSIRDMQDGGDIFGFERFQNVNKRCLLTGKIFINAKRRGSAENSKNKKIEKGDRRPIIHAWYSILVWFLNSPQKDTVKKVPPVS